MGGWVLELHGYCTWPRLVANEIWNEVSFWQAKTLWKWRLGSGSFNSLTTINPVYGLLFFFSNLEMTWRFLFILIICLFGPIHAVLFNELSDTEFVPSKIILSTIWSLKMVVSNPWIHGPSRVNLFLLIWRNCSWILHRVGLFGLGAVCLHVTSLVSRQSPCQPWHSCTCSDPIWRVFIDNYTLRSFMKYLTIIWNLNPFAVMKF